MKWKFIDSGLNTGKFNMDFDVFLAENFEKNTAVLRLYQWNPFCISLGANQSFDEIDLNKTQYNQIDVVKRPTGGRAILHSQELTYSVIYPIEMQSSAKNIYNDINLALRKGLIKYNPKLGEIDLQHAQPDFKEFYKKEIGAICFAVSAKSELNFRGKKLVGSAQRKMGNVILQHGSILCGDYHMKIIDYLKINEIKKKEIQNEISLTTIDLKTALNYDINYGKLNSSVLEGFEEHFNSIFEKIEQSSFELNSV